MSSINLQKLSRMPRRVATYSTEPAVQNDEEWIEICRMPLLRSFAQNIGLDLDFSVVSLEILDAEFSALLVEGHTDLVYEIAYYLGEVLCRIAPDCTWKIERSGHPVVKMNEVESWDVIYFVGAQGRPVRPRLQDGLAQTLSRVSGSN